MQLLMTTIRNISYSKHFSLGLFEHLKHFIVLNAQKQISNDLIQKNPEWPKICASFLAEVFTFTRNHEHFQRHFGFIEKDFILTLVEFISC